MIRKNGLYDKIAKFYDTFDSYYEHKTYSKMRAKYLTDITHATILEIGVGTGKNLEYYNDINNKIVAIDVSKGMLLEAGEKLRTLPNSLQQIINLQKVNRNWDLKNDKFQYIVATFVLCTNNDPSDLIEQMYSALEPSGTLILFEWVPSIKGVRGISLRIMDPFLNYFLGVSVHRTNSLRYFSKEQWRLIKKEYFDSENVALTLQKKALNN